jgi:hypothetical protein
MRNLTIAALAVATVLGAAAVNDKASAMPLNGLTPVVTQSAVSVEKVAWVCGPYRCWRQPGPYWRSSWGGYWAPRRYWGWGGDWHRWGWGWHRWGWHRRWW